MLLSITFKVVVRRRTGSVRLTGLTSSEGGCVVVSLSVDSLALTRMGLSRSWLREDETLAGMRGAPRTQGTVCDDTCGYRV